MGIRRWARAPVEHGLFGGALRTGLESEHDFQVVGEARNGPEAFAEVGRTILHVAIVDIDLPVTDGRPGS